MADSLDGAQEIPPDFRCLTVYRFSDWYSGLLQFNLWEQPFNEVEEFRVLQREFNFQMQLRKPPEEKS